MTLLSARRKAGPIANTANKKILYGKSGRLANNKAC